MQQQPARPALSLRRLMYRPTDLPEVLGFSPHMVRKLLARGELPSRRWGKRVVILHSDLTNFLEGLPPPGLEDRPTE
jgi:hypothetical protein